MNTLNIQSHEALKKELLRFCCYSSIETTKIDDYINLYHPVTIKRIRQRHVSDVKEQKYTEERNIILEMGIPIDDDGKRLKFEQYEYYPRSGVFFVNGKMSGIGFDKLLELMK